MSELMVTLAALVIVVAALKVARPILLPLVASAFLAALMAPAAFHLKQRRVPPFVSIPLLLLFALVVTAAVASFLVGTINEFVAAAPSYQDSLDAMGNDLLSWLASMGFGLTALELRELVQPSAAIRLAGRTFSELAGLLSNMFLVLLTTVFVLFEAMELPDKLRLAFRDPDVDLSRAARVIVQVKNYVVLKTYVSLATGALIAVCLVGLGIDFPLLWGLLAFLLNFIPNIGSIIAAIPTVLLALVQYGPGRALGTAIAYLAVNLIVGNFIEPRVMGRQLGLSPLVVVVSLVFWGWLWGPLGMLLSVPLTMILRIVLEHSEQTRIIAVLMGNRTR